MSFNTLGIIVLIVSTLAFLIYLFTISQKDEFDFVRDKFDTDSLKEYVINEISSELSQNLYMEGLAKTEFDSLIKQKSEFKKSNDRCNKGSLEDKIYIINKIKNMMYKVFKDNSDKIVECIQFDEPSKLNYIDKFNILLEIYKKDYGYDAVTHIIEEYDLTKPKDFVIDDSCEYKLPSYKITKEDIDKVFNDKYIIEDDECEDGFRVLDLDYDTKLELISRKIYSEYKGEGPIDYLLEMNIDGLNAGTSGHVLRGADKELLLDMVDMDDFDKLLDKEKDKQYSHDGIWLYHDAKFIKLDFLSFGSNSELKRVTSIIYRNNAPGQLSKKKGYIMSSRLDRTRTVAFRPPFAESYAFFVRKFTNIKNYTIRTLIGNHNVEGSEMVINMLEFMALARYSIAFTGKQGAGKTTLLVAMTKYLDPKRSIRVIEAFFESFLREVTSCKNILTFAYNDHISEIEAQDISKKTDADITINTEVATDASAANIVRSSKSSSDTIWLTHHGLTARGTVGALRDSCVNSGLYKREDIAEQEVVSMLDANIHLGTNKNTDERYLERITEILPLENSVDYMDISLKDSLSNVIKKKAFNEKVYYEKETQNDNFKTVDIIVYKNGKYVAVNKPSEAFLLKAYKNMPKEVYDKFKEFVIKTWGDL